MESAAKSKEYLLKRIKDLETARDEVSHDILRNIYDEIISEIKKELILN